jgi:S-formylglutathione hydrolase FrmB
MLVALVLVLGWSGREARASWKKDSSALAVLNRRLAGRVVDYTANHGQDNRIWSRSLHQRRDLYVYLPPHYDPSCRYPIIIFLHGFAQDEQAFLTLVAKIDEAMSRGQLPPAIVAAPDGSPTGEPSYTQPGSFFINSQAGDFENWVLHDLWDFLCEHYPIRPERQAHVLAGVSMGGFAAFSLGIRHRDCIGVAVGIHPPLNLRWVDQDGYYFAKFDPRFWGWRDKIDNRHEPIAKFYGGVVKVRIGNIVDPLFGFGDDAIEEIARHNPIELVDATHLHNGDLAMFAGYAGRDQFNVDAQVESFLYLAHCRGISVGVAFEPNGQHDTATAFRMWPAVVEWLAPRLAPFNPRTGMLP